MMGSLQYYNEHFIISPPLPRLTMDLYFIVTAATFLLFFLKALMDLQGPRDPFQTPQAASCNEMWSSSWSCCFYVVKYCLSGQ